jgi:HSP20 family protein
MPFGLDQGLAFASPMPGAGAQLPFGAWGAGMAHGAPGQGPGQPGPAEQGLAGVPRLPAVDLVDAGDSFVVQVELPGVKKDDLDILVSERHVQIRGEARPEVKERAQPLVRERGPVSYQRAIPLPTEVHTTEGKAVFKDGVLTLTIPKKQPTEGPKRVDVAYG